LKLVHRRDSHRAARRRAGRRIAAVAWVFAWLAPAAGFAPVAAAFELHSVETSRDGEAYLLRIEASFQAPPEQLLQVLTDYDNIHQLHHRMVESRSLGAVGPSTEEVFTRFEGCVLMFCRAVSRVEQIRVEGNTLHATDVPRRGSFSEGETVWRFAPEADGARLHYQARVVPAFSVTPVVGPIMLARALEQMTLETMAEADKRAAMLDE